MASQDVTVNSRLAEMQMKFQKQQKLEREQKMLTLVGGEISQASKTTAGNGKVRQMFDDRRRGVGIDRSHPLRPIVASSSVTTGTPRTATQQCAGSSNALVGGANIARRPGFTNSTSKQSKTINRSILNNYSTSNGNTVNVFRNNFDEVDNIDNETFPAGFSSLSLNNTHVIRSYARNDSDFENNNNEETSILGGTVVINKNTTPKTNAIKLNPVITKKSISTSTAVKTTATRTSSNTSRGSSQSKISTSSIKSPPPKVTSPTTKSIKVVGKKPISYNKPATFILSVKPPPRISTPPPGMASCQNCQRHFNEERLVKHEEVCRKMMTKKRKIFDASKHRVKGTEAENYLKKGSTTSKAVTPATSTSKAAKTPVETKSNWRRKHEDFIAAIREAKKVQAHLAKGGKLSDLPPPPPSENPDYIQCPHCSRRFNQSAAERHIPKCANMQHNKPKPTKKRL